MNITIRLTKVEVEMLKELQKKDKRYKRGLEEKLEKEIKTHHTTLRFYRELDSRYSIHPSRESRIFCSNQSRSLFLCFFFICFAQFQTPLNSIKSKSTCNVLVTFIFCLMHSENTHADPSHLSQYHPGIFSIASTSSGGEHASATQDMIEGSITYDGQQETGRSAQF